MRHARPPGQSRPMRRVLVVVALLAVSCGSLPQALRPASPSPSASPTPERWLMDGVSGMTAPTYKATYAVHRRFSNGPIDGTETKIYQ